MCAFHESLNREMSYDLEKTKREMFNYNKRPEPIPSVVGSAPHQRPFSADIDQSQYTSFSPFRGSTLAPRFSSHERPTPLMAVNNAGVGTATPAAVHPHQSSGASISRHIGHNSIQSSTFARAPRRPLPMQGHSPTTSLNMQGNSITSPPLGSVSSHSHLQQGTVAPQRTMGVPGGIAGGHLSAPQQPHRPAQPHPRRAHLTHPTHYVAQPLTRPMSQQRPQGHPGHRPHTTPPQDAHNASPHSTSSHPPQIVPIATHQSVTPQMPSSSPQESASQISATHPLRQPSQSPRSASQPSRRPPPHQHVAFAQPSPQFSPHAHRPSSMTLLATSHTSGSDSYSLQHTPNLLNTPPIIDGITSLNPSQLATLNSIQFSSVKPALLAPTGNLGATINHPRPVNLESSSRSIVTPQHHSSQVHNPEGEGPNLNQAYTIGRTVE
eukprot:GHVN01081095.1.p1 GENE.GHVN01081095.1~~GHVN01081095.1.p1  ORF type:complete len:437 (-),score=98.72 GHVN01081095.1:504-1814(-)